MASHRVIEMERVGIAVVLVLCIAWQVEAQAVTCTAAGRYADTTDPTCQNYTLCVYNSTSNSYVSYNYVCPSTSVFNPTTSLCTAPANYVCPTTTTTTASACTADGYIADPTSTDCSSYIICVDLGNGTFSETTQTCPTATYYDPTTTFCESTYTCTTTFTCTTAGRFANTTDTACQSYYFCVLAANGTYLEYSYTCPTTSVFNPTSGLCTTSYTCTTAAG